MKWHIEYSKNAIKFIKRNNLEKTVHHELKKFILRITGKPMNIDIKKLTGNWSGFYRIRKGQIRIKLFC
ncbi:MAG: hypothetical protein OEZ22_12510 [Spirochaetia bacterium]|nr:hypothetical protein [Spirochaetia bacterium]